MREPWVQPLPFNNRIVDASVDYLMEESSGYRCNLSPRLEYLLDLLLLQVCWQRLVLGDKMQEEVVDAFIRRQEAL